MSDFQVNEPRVERHLVVLASSTWVTELSAEMIRAGFPEADAPRRATHVLGRICRHAGWERNHFLVDESDPEPVKERPDNRRKTMRSKP